MAEEGTQEQTAEEAWREVGEQVEALGESLSTAFRAAWESDETQRHVRSMQDGLEKMVDRVGQTVKEARESQRGQRIRAEAEKTADTLRVAGEQTWQETRPQLLSLLKKINAELQKFTESLERKPEAASKTSEPPSSESKED